MGSVSRVSAVGRVRERSGVGGMGSYLPYHFSSSAAACIGH